MADSGLKGEVIKAYLTLSCNMPKAKRYIAPDLRKTLAERLTGDMNTGRPIRVYVAGPFSI